MNSDVELLHEDELEPEALEEGVTESDLEERSELEEEKAEFETAETEGEEEREGEFVLTQLEPEQEAEGDEAETTLDEILRQRFEGEEEHEEEEPEARAVASSEEEVRPRSAEEFVCQSCFLVKHRAQLADARRSLCQECVNNAST